jgi:hypothetical protein
VQHLVVTGAFQHVAQRPGAHGREHGGVIFQHRHHHHAGLRVALQDAAGGFNAVHLRHVDVHQHDIRLQSFRLGDRFAAGRRLTHHQDIGDGGQQSFYAVPE